MLKTLEGKELTKLLLTTRKFPPVFSDEFGNLTFSSRRPLSYRNQSIDLASFMKGLTDNTTVYIIVLNVKMYVCEM